MTALTQAFVAVRPDMNSFGPEVKRNLSSIDTSREGAKVGGKFGKGFSGAVGSAAKGAAGLLAGAFATIGAGKFLKDAVGSASDLGETTSKIAQIFGPASKDIQKFAASASTSLGQTQQAALDANATFGLFGKSAGLKGKDLTGFTTKLSTLSSDLASFNNTSPEQAIEAIGAALRGESEPIRSYGVLLDDATLKAEAMRLGLVKTTGDTTKIAAAQLRAEVAQKKYNAAVKEHGKNSTEAKSAQAGLISAQGALKTATAGTVQPLTQQQKVLAAQSAILKQTKTAQGDFARTSGGLANQQRIAAAQTNKLKVAIGNALLPVLTAGAVTLNTKLLPPLIDLAEEHGPKLAKTLADAGAKAGPFVRDFLDKAGPALASFRDGSNEASPALASLSDSAAKLGPFIQELAAKVPSLTDALNVGAEVVGFFADHTDELAKAMPILVGAIVAYKVAQLAANAAAVLAVPTKVAEVLVNRQLVKSNRELIASRAGVVASTVADTVATGANTGAKNAGILASVRSRAATLAAAAAQKIAAAASVVASVAMRGIGIAMRFALGPVGLIITAIGLLVAGLIYAYKHSETFRDIVNGVWKAVSGAAQVAFKAVVGFVTGAIDWITTNFPKLVTIITTPFTVSQKAIGTAWEAIKTGVKSALAWIVDKVLAFGQTILEGAGKAFGWVPGLGDKLKGAATEFGKFRDDVNRKLTGIDDQQVAVTADLKSWGTPELLAAAHGRANGGPIRGPGSGTSDTAGLFALSNKEWVIRAASSQKYGDQAMKSVNDGTATIIPGFAKGGRPGLVVDPRLPSGHQTQVAANNVASAVSSIGREMAPVMAKIMEKALGINPALNKVLTFVASQVGKPYGWGAVGPASYDCSGLVSAAVNVARGKRPNSRLGGTGSMPWAGMVGGPGAFEIGWFAGDPGHTAATVNKVNIESAGGVGVRMGNGARGARDAMFTNRAHLKGFARGGKVGRWLRNFIPSRHEQHMAHLTHLAHVQHLAHVAHLIAGDSEGGFIGAGARIRGDAPFDLVDPRGQKYLGKRTLKQLGVGSFAEGAWNLRSNQTAFLHRGEMVVPANVAARLRARIAHVLHLRHQAHVDHQAHAAHVAHQSRFTEHARARVRSKFPVRSTVDGLLGGAVAGTGASTSSRLHPDDIRSLASALSREISANPPQIYMDRQRLDRAITRSALGGGL